MMRPGILSPICVLLAVLTAVPGSFGQTPPVPPSPPLAVPAPPASAPTSAPAAPLGKIVRPEPAGEPLHILILEGKNSVNSIPLMRSVPPVIEVHDQNDFPIEGATVVFSVPDIGPGGTFAGGTTKFSTRTDSHGQAGAPLMVPRNAGKFQIRVAVAYGTQKAEELVTQINSQTDMFGTLPPKKPWYTKKKNLILLGSAVAAGIVVLVLTTGGSSSPSSIVITPGTPVFH